MQARFILFICFFILLSISGFTRAAEKWGIVLSPELARDPAIQLAVDDLQKTGAAFGLELTVLPQANLRESTILVGSPARNALTGRIAQKHGVKLELMSEPEGFVLQTVIVNGKKLIFVHSGSVTGEVYGLYWIWDRLRVFRQIPEMNCRRIPEVPVRYADGGMPDHLRDALRHGANWVTSTYSTNQLVPWSVEPEKSANIANREAARKQILAAQALHLKCLVYEDEFSYLPSLLEEFGAKPTPADPAFWDAVQAKYRRLFQALPEIDGIRVRTGESTRIGGNFKSLDVMHAGEDCDWSLAKRYRTFVKKIYHVVVGEFDKIYYQRTWVTNEYEQHSRPDVYREIFTDDIPTRNLYLSPYLSQADRFFFQPYNPTFNQTPHNMVVLLSTLDYHARTGEHIFPSFPGTWYQGGLETILAPANRNVQGVHFSVPNEDGWHTGHLSAYTAYRLSWNHQENVREIARDFAAIHFGNEVADALAEIILLSPVAYKYGVYIEPVAFGDFRSLLHLRLNIFPVKGFPQIDHGKENLTFLKNIYLRCRPWLDETLMYLDHGLATANEMVAKFQTVKSDFGDPRLAEKVEHSLQVTQKLVQTNNWYVKTFFAYFQYRENPDAANRVKLADLSGELAASMTAFLAVPGCDYDLAGMIQLQKNVADALADLPRAEAVLARAPEPDRVAAVIEHYQAKAKSVLDENQSGAVRCLHWKGRIDGQDLLKISGRDVRIQHLRFDPIQNMEFEIPAELPRQAVTVIARDIQSRSFHPFVLEQPTEKNNYTATIFLSDFPCHGYSQWEFELYYIEKTPAELTVVNPWEVE